MEQMGSEVKEEVVLVVPDLEAENNLEDLGALAVSSENSGNFLKVPTQTKVEGSELLKQDKIDQIMAMKVKLTQLVENIRDTKLLCEKYENENQYLQDYIGNYMKSDLK